MLAVPTARAVDLAAELLSGTGVISIMAGVELRADRAALERELGSTIGVAVESLVPARRGRPRRRIGLD